MSDTDVSRKALIFIFITIFIDITGLGLIIPVIPKIISGLAATGMSEAARYGGWLFFVYALMQFLCAPIIGNLSDRFGRKPVLILSLVMIGVDYTITGLAPTIAWLFVGRTLSGMAGASYTTANAYIADVTPPEKRAQSFGLVGAAFGFGFIVGPALGGIIGEHGARLPFFAAAGLAAANALFGLLVLKESLPRERRRTFELWRANPLGALAALRRFPFVLGLCAVLVLMQLAHDAYPAVWTYYTMLKFHWSTADVGYSLMTVGLLAALIFGGLTRVAVPRLGEVRAAYLGLLAGAAGFAGYAFAATSWQLYGWMIVGSLMGLANPAISAIMSRQVAPGEQGELQGAITSVTSLTSIAAPPALASLFAWFTGRAAPVYFPGVAFFAGSLCLVAAVIAFAWVRPDTINRPADTTPADTTEASARPQPSAQT